mmetsp:Transcript_119157/g.333827  ORF Transcript_119157/g.333827 Transcript_119157/m.333827 type:complete len:81 (-) Transcript_119157:258-500(-)
MPLSPPLALVAAVLACAAPCAGAVWSNPACWISWRTTIEQNGKVIEGDACMMIGWVTVLNVFCFYLVFLFLVRSLILATQ